MNRRIDITKVILKTERLTLRPWRESDLKDFYEYASVDGVGQMAGWIPHQNMEESERILSSFIQNKKTFALEYKGKVIGSLGIEKYTEELYPELDSLQGREIGYVLSKEYWGRGLMPEAAKAVIDWLFDEEKLDFILAGHFEWNRQSRSVIEKCGFRDLIRWKPAESISCTIRKGGKPNVEPQRNKNHRNAQTHSAKSGSGRCRADVPQLGIGSGSHQVSDLGNI